MKVYHDTIAALEVELTAIDHKRIKVAQAIDMLRSLVDPGVPVDEGEEMPEPSRTKVTNARAKAPKGDLPLRVLEALKVGPASTGELAERVKAGYEAAKHVVNVLASRGSVHRTGTGPRNYRWHLGSAKAAKEAP